MSSTNQLASSNPSVRTIAGANGTAGAGDDMTRAGEILQIVSAASQADITTLRSISAMLGCVNTTHTTAITDKPSTPELDKEAAKNAKRQKRLEKELGEHVTASDDLAMAGRGVFDTPAGNRNATASVRIRIHNKYQANIPAFNPGGVVDDRGDTLDGDPVGSADASITAGCVKKLRSCGTPGCILPDNHMGPHSAEVALLPSRRFCFAYHRVGKKPEEGVTEERSGGGIGKESSDDKDDKVKKIISGKRVILQTTASGRSVMGGSAPVLCDMDSRRCGIVDNLKIKFGSDFGGEEAGIEELAGHFTALLIIAGYSEGSYNKERDAYTMDGTVYKYPRYLRKFMEAGVFGKRSDFFKDGAKDKAVAFATTYGVDAAMRSPKYSGMNDHQRSVFANRHKLNLMHGFDDFVKLAGK